MPPGPKGKKSSEENQYLSDDGDDGTNGKKPYTGRWRLFEFREGNKEKTDEQLGKAITDQLDFFKGKPVNPEQVPLKEMVSAADYSFVSALLRQWDMEKYEEAVKELRTEYKDVKEYNDNRVLDKFTVEEFQAMYESRGKIPFKESSFLELLPPNIKYTREIEALKGIPRDFREWMHKAEETFSSKPEVRQSEKAVVRLLSRCPPAMKEHLTNLQAQLKKSDDPLEANNLMLYVREVETLAAAIHDDGPLARYHAVILEKYDNLKAETKVEATTKSGGSNKSQGKSQGGGMTAKEKYLANIQKNFPNYKNNTEFQTLIKKHDGFYNLCVNCGKKGVHTQKCNCGLDGKESKDPEVSQLHADFDKYKALRKAYNK